MTRYRKPRETDRAKRAVTLYALRQLGAPWRVVAARMGVSRERAVQVSEQRRRDPAGFVGFDIPPEQWISKRRAREMMPMIEAMRRLLLKARDRRRRGNGVRVSL